MTLLTFLTRLLCGDWSGLDMLSGWRTRGCPIACCLLPWRRPDQRVAPVSDGEIIFCLMCMLGMHLTPGLSPPLPRELSGALCSPPQYDLFSSLKKSNARCAFVCFLVEGTKRHKCTAERQKRIDDQRGSCRCTHCGRCFWSKGRLAVHRCCPPPSSHPLQRKPAASKRLPTRRPTISERDEFILVCACGRCFRRQHDLSHHRPF